ncbi:probable GPI-anchored adhesin-like protein PGA18 [Notolabrus celidotus]|uniref:probable GPI-anchored adhesin-like protein PGA18 n=1 Tax=Notolabrus celidotus TaxID=1203425 RepID=UPI001490804E|nr:probable GPI-anchored adhesin-like protein PGA18 [Notolabrus celidotus]
MKKSVRLNTRLLPPRPIRRLLLCECRQKRKLTESSVKANTPAPFTQPAVTSASSATQPAVTSASSATQPAVTSASSATQPAVTSASSATQPAVTSASSATQPAVTSASAGTSASATTQPGTTPEEGQLAVDDHDMPGVDRLDLLSEFVVSMRNSRGQHNHRSLPDPAAL